MSLSKAVGGSNPAEANSDQGPNTGDGGVAMLGYSVVGFPSQGPARTNADVTITKSSIASDQEGTSLPAYSLQPEKPNAESGK